MARPGSSRSGVLQRLRAVPGLLLAFGRRIYAVVVIGVTAWVSFLAIRYLVVTLMFPSPAPAQITGIPTRLNRAVLDTRRTEWAGVASNVNPRAPLAHYHRLDGWIQPDPHNSCTQSGCHAPLPHSRRKEVRAFLNMHATTLHCGVCHMTSDQTPLPLTWYSLADGEACGPPSILKAYALLAAEQPVYGSPVHQQNTTVQRELASLLSMAAEESDGVPALAELARHLAAVPPNGEAFGQLVEAARATLPRHFHGSYGAKLSLLNRPGGEPLLGHPGTAGPVKEFLQRGASLSPADRLALLARVHPRKRVQTLQCSECHSPGRPLVDLSKVGYPPARLEALSQPAVIRMIQHSSEGQPMHMREFFTPQPQPQPQPQPE